MLYCSDCELDYTEDEKLCNICGGKLELKVTETEKNPSEIVENSIPSSIKWGKFDYFLLAFGIVLIFSLIYQSSLFSPATQSRTIKITGTDGVKFSGDYSITSSEGVSDSFKVDGTVPIEFPFIIDGDSSIFLVLHKRSDKGTLKVEILKKGWTIAKTETSDKYGAVSLAAKL